MTDLVFTDKDLIQLKKRGIAPEEVERQIYLFKNPPAFIKLIAPCVPGKGIKVLDRDVIQGLVDNYESAIRGRQLTKFVPASGAASRMFKVLQKFLHQDGEININSIASEAREDSDAELMFEFMSGIKRFAFFDDLKAAMARDGLDLESLIEKGTFTKVVEYLLSPEGLDYTNLPKGLLQFHHYPEGDRTSFEEHLVEAANYVRDNKGVCRIHFTISPEHKEKFAALLDKVVAGYEQKFGVRYEIDFSVQKESTDTIAVDMENRPFRLDDGDLYFRPGGHGALINNLNDLAGDIVFIKNIDNIIPDRLKPDTYFYKKVLAGYLIEIQSRIFELLEGFSNDPGNEKLLSEAIAFAKTELLIELPEGMENASLKAKADFIKSKFERPIRVCGMVKNEGEPGGGPFISRSKDGGISLQIVESAQVDPDSKSQKEIWTNATHFNPVDLVCGLRDRQGNPFELTRYVDQDAVFISTKSKDGSDLKALELPGLWNGAMADWNTVFIEVPIITFNPVKTIVDLLRKEHQPE